jgi:cytochrome c oxidase subunit 2
MAAPSRSLYRWSLLALAVAAVTLAACNENYPQSTLAPASDFARAIDDLLDKIVWWGLLVFVLVEGLLLFAIFRFRRRAGAEEVPEAVHGHTRLEIAWTIAPALILAFIAVPTIRTIFVTQDDKPIPGALQVRVVGHQWWWEFEYPDLGFVTANELHLPVGRTASFTMESADVVHSFWIPRLAGKRDVIPTHKNHLWFTPDSAGTYTGQCAEFCGASHAWMGLRVVVDTPEDFETWVANEQRAAVGSPAPGDTAAAGAETATAAPEGAEATATVPEEAEAAAAPAGSETGAATATGEPLQEPAATPADSVARTFAAIGDAARGAQLFERSACVACHTIRGTKARARIGPDLTHVGSRQMIAADMLPNTPDNLARWLDNPPGVKPGALMPDLNLKEDQIADLVTYLQSLK